MVLYTDEYVNNSLTKTVCYSVLLGLTITCLLSSNITALGSKSVV